MHPGHATTGRSQTGLREVVTRGHEPGGRQRVGSGSRPPWLIRTWRPPCAPGLRSTGHSFWPDTTRRRSGRPYTAEGAPVGSPPPARALPQSQLRLGRDGRPGEVAFAAPLDTRAQEFYGLTESPQADCREGLIDHGNALRFTTRCRASTVHARYFTHRLDSHPDQRLKTARSAERRYRS